VACTRTAIVKRGEKVKRGERKKKNQFSRKPITNKI